MMRWRRPPPRRLETRAVERAIICTPDKDLAQCVRGTRIVQMDRRTRTIRDEAGDHREVRRARRYQFPTTWPSVGDSGGRLSRRAGLGRQIHRRRAREAYGHLESIPADWRTWGVNAAHPGALAHALERERDHAFLFRDLATLRSDISLFASVDELHWSDPTAAFGPLAARLRPPSRRSRPRASVSASPRNTTGTRGISRKFLWSSQLGAGRWRSDSGGTGAGRYTLKLVPSDSDEIEKPAGARRDIDLALPARIPRHRNFA